MTGHKASQSRGSSAVVEACRAPWRLAGCLSVPGMEDSVGTAVILKVWHGEAPHGGLRQITRGKSCILPKDRVQVQGLDFIYDQVFLQMSYQHLLQRSTQKRKLTCH